MKNADSGKKPTSFRDKTEVTKQTKNEKGKMFTYKAGRKSVKIQKNKREEIPPGVPRGLVEGDERMDRILNPKMGMSEELRERNEWFWRNYIRLRPMYAREHWHGGSGVFVGTRFSERNAAGRVVVAHWEADNGIAWLKMRKYTDEGRVNYYWSPLVIAVGGKWSADVVFYIFQKGLIFQDPVWHGVESYMYRVMTCDRMDKSEGLF